MSFYSGNELSNKFDLNKNDLPSIREKNKMPFIRRGNTIYYLSSFEENKKTRDILTSRECAIMSISNNKGGVKKTTSTINIGSSFAFRGLKVLLIDADRQCNLTRHFKVETKSIVESMDDGKLEVTSIKNDIYRFGKLDIVGNDFKRKLDYDFDYKVLDNLLKTVKKEYDIIIFDTPPEIEKVTLACLKVSDYVFIPLLPDEYSTIGAINLLEVISNINIKLLGGFITANHKNYSTDIVAIENIQTIFKDVGSHLCPTYISNSNIFEEIATRRDKNSILEFQPKHKCTSEYLELTNYLMYKMIEGS